VWRVLPLALCCLRVSSHHMLSIYKYALIHIDGQTADGVWCVTHIHEQHDIVDGDALSLPMAACPATDQTWLGAGVWKQAAPMTCSRRGLAAASSEGRIYVAGGWDGRKYLDSMAIFDTFTGKWANGPAMLCPRCFAAATFVGPHLYVVGGYYGATNLRSAERFDPVVCHNSLVLLYIYLVILR